ncbi:MAG: hypothetical protein ACFFG0_36335 [Candidatus Thorarchaeota archaeon]
MKRWNKDGRPIYSNGKWYKLKQTGEILKKLGYSESYKKPNLFYKKINGGFMYADLRGTVIIPIWDDLRPLVYKSESLVFASFMKEVVNMKRSGCDPRGSFYDMCEPGGWGFLLYDGKIPAGYCKRCGKDIINSVNWDILLEDFYITYKKGIDSYLELNYCNICRKIEYSKKMFRSDNLKDKNLCEICEKNEAEIKHHITYDPPKTIKICRSCHGKIHKFGSNFPNPLWKEKKENDNNRKGFSDIE